MKKLSALLAVILIVSSLTFCFAGCSQSVEVEDAWSAFDEAYQESLSYTQGKSYFVKYIYKDDALGATVTQKLNVVYGNKYIDGWDDFVSIDKGVEKAYLTKTDYTNSYFGYALKKDVKARKATKEDYKLGFWRERVVEEKGKKKKYYDHNEMDIERYFALKAGDSVGDKQVSADEEVYKYTLGYALATLEGINPENAELIAATKNGIVTILNFIVKDESHVYGKYNEKSNCLVVQITKGRITKIANPDGRDFAYYLNYAGPKLSLPAYSE